MTLAPTFPVPRQITSSFVSVSSGAVPTVRVDGYVVVDSWNPTARTFQVVTKTSAAVADPDDNSLVSFYLRGPAVDSFTDPV